MKRILQILVLLILLIVAAAVVLPIVFKDEIIAKAQEEINKNLEAKVGFKEIDISIFKTFPNFNLTIETFTVDGINEFDGIRLAEVGVFEVELDIISVITGDEFKVETIALRDASVHVVVNKEGKANYDIAKADTTAKPIEINVPEAEGEEPTNFQLALQSYVIENFNLIYDDQQGQVKAVIKDLDHRGTGDFTEEVVNLKTKTTIEGLTVESEGVAYLKQVKTTADFDIEFNQPQFKITFGENTVSMNDLSLNFTGFVALPEDDIDMDLAFSSPQNSFKSVLSLIPGVFTKDFEDIKTTGKFNFDGKVVGVFNSEKEQYPPFDINFNVSDASFQYPDLPASVSGIEVNTHIYNRSADLDGMVIDVTKAKALIAESPIDAKLNLKTPISDPVIKTYINTSFDLGNIAKVFPVEGIAYSGTIKGNLDIAARMSDIDNELYENVKADGSVEMANIKANGDSLPVDINIPVASMLFSPQYVDLQNFEMLLGESDIKASGKIDNLLAYALKDEVLKANFQLNSELLNLNELTSSMMEEESGTEANTDENVAKEETVVTNDSSALEVMRIPQNIDFQLTSNLKKVIYDDLTIENLVGDIVLKEGEARMDNVSMDMIGGSVAMNGGYNSKPEQPTVDMDLKVKDFSFKESFNAFDMIKTMVPLMEKTEGSYSTNFTLKSALNGDMSPDLATVLAGGALLTKGMKTTPNSMQKLADMVKNPSLASLDIGKVDIKFKIEDGRLTVEPFEVKAGNISANVYGSQGLDQSLDYTMDMKIPTSGLGNSGLLGSIGGATGGKIDLGVKIGGTATKPTVSTSLGSVLNNVVDNLTHQLEDKVEEVKREVVDKVNEEAKKLIDEASKAGDKLIATAETQAQALRDAAKAQAQKLRNEADKKATALEDEGKGNFLKEAAAKEGAKVLRDKADKQAVKLEAEADKKANALIQKAKDQKQKLIQEAEAKGKIK